MRIVYFTHSLKSCWNHGNAHFLRGVLRELIALGHDVSAFEPAGSWSLSNLLQDHGPRGLMPFEAAYPELSSHEYAHLVDVEGAVADADLVIVHEWNEASLVACLGALRRKGGRFMLLFHDTHHRAVSDPDGIRAFNLEDYDAVLLFGEALADVYRRWGWGNRAFVWHEAADTRHFHPPSREGFRAGAVWIGNWGDGERSVEVAEFLLRAASAAEMPLDVYGVRYPAAALRLLARYGADYRGWLANARTPDVYAAHLATVHVPRRFYASILPGIPTIRVFEALACGIPLISTLWQDTEALFTPGRDYLVARDGAEVAKHLKAVRDDPGLRKSLSDAGLATIRARHTCAHRAQELLAIGARLISGRLETAA